MTWIERWWRRGRMERQLDAELRFHLDEETSRLEASGLPHDEARRRAFVEFGGLEPIKEAARDVRGTRWLEDTVQDLRYALRTMRRHPAFAIAAVLSLAIGIGANTAIFGVVNALLIRALPVPSPNELTYLTRTGPAAEGRPAQAVSRFSRGAFVRYQEALQPAHTSLAAMTSVARMQLSVAGANGDDGAELVLAQLVSGNWFSVLGVGPERGRLLTDADDGAADGQPVAVLSDGYWARRFARDPSIVGATIRLNGAPLTVVGIAGAPFDGFIVGDPVDVWVPTGLQRRVRYATNADMTDADPSKPWGAQEGVAWLTLVGRVHAPAARSAASAIADTAFRRDVDAQAAQIRNPQQRAYVLRTHAALANGSRGLSDIRDQFGRAVLVLMTTVALVLLVACANLANLLMARSAARSREIAVRLSLGAARGRLVRQLLTESLLLALLGGAASLLFARAGSQALLRLASDGPAPMLLDVSFGWPMVAFAIGVATATGVLFGLLPALRFSRPDLHEAIKLGGRTGELGGRLPGGRLLVVAQVTLSFALLAGALVFVRTLHNLLTIDPGFRAAHLVTARFDPRMAGYTAATMASLRERLLDGARAIPGAQSAAVAMCGTMANCHAVSDIDVPGRQPGVGDDNDVQEDYVTGGYFGALGMEFVAGRNFSAADTERSPHVAIVNEAMARHFFPDVNAVGKRFSEGDTYEIVGVVRDSRINGLRETPPRMVFYPYSQHQAVPLRNVYARMDGDVAAAARALREVIRAADRGIAVREVVTLAELEERSVARERLVSTLTGVFGLLAVAVACLGLYAMVSYSVTRRTNEIGIRLALGASRSSVRWLVMRETLALAALGIGVGVIVTIPALGLVEALLYGLSAHDPAALTLSAATLAAVAGLAGAGPAWRASRVDPARALRSE
ncbi:MAG TPA: ABC transporter permease [Vicinamibacterales bacterium]|nr:ABC transporter permease [Vicinamibacterales bacterium]